MGTAGASATGPAPVPSTTKAARSRRIHPRIYPLASNGRPAPVREPTGGWCALVVVRVVRDRGRGVRRVAAGRGGGCVRRRRGGGWRAGVVRRLDRPDGVAATTVPVSTGHVNLRVWGALRGCDRAR